MASPIGLRGTLHVQSDDQGSSIPIHISEEAGVRAENLSLSTWGASFVLANLLYRLHVPAVASPDNQAKDGAVTRRPQVLELGAGTGLVGISAAALWRAQVLLTDLAPILPGLAASVSLNRKSLPPGSARCASLDWRYPEGLSLLQGHPSESVGPPFSSTDFQADVILAADTIYSEDHPELLVKTILQWLAHTRDSRVILCYPLRMAYIDHVRAFWDLMEASGFECLDEGREEGDESWNEVANTPYEYCVWRWRASADDNTK